jgi:DNA-binding ferritin-like protein
MEAMQLPSESQVKPIIDLLNGHLTSAVDLQLRIRNAVWNSENPRPAEARELSTTATEIEQFCELIAERMRALGTDAQATLQRAQTRSFLEPCPPVIADEQGHISAIAHALVKLRQSAKQARKQAAVLRDETTATLFDKLASAIDTQIWFLRSPPPTFQISYTNCYKS